MPGFRMPCPLRAKGNAAILARHPRLHLRRRPFDLAVGVVLHRPGRRAGCVLGRRRVTCGWVRRGRLVTRPRGCGVRGPSRVPGRMTGSGMVSCRRRRVATALRPRVTGAAAPALRAGEGQDGKQERKNKQNLHGGFRRTDCRPPDGHKMSHRPGPGSPASPRRTAWAALEVKRAAPSPGPPAPCLGEDGTVAAQERRGHTRSDPNVSRRRDGS
jgi:hypothetical protein